MSNSNDQSPRQTEEQRRYLSSLSEGSHRRYAARQQHQFRDSIGGCSSNYRF